jgi:hypothetical protein
MRRALETENVAEFLHAVFSGIPCTNEAVTIARPARMDRRWRAFFESYSCRVSGASSLPLSEIDLTRHERSPGGRSSVENLSGVLPLLMSGFVIQPV